VSCVPTIPAGAETGFAGSGPQAILIPQALPILATIAPRRSDSNRVARRRD